MAEKTEEHRTGATPHGGVRSVIYYLDANNEPCTKERAVTVEIIEIDAHGKEIFRHYGRVNGRAG